MESTPDESTSQTGGRTAEARVVQTLHDFTTSSFDLFSVTEDYPIRVRELITIVAVVILCDLTVYNGDGFLGGALFVLGVPLLLLVGIPRLRVNKRVLAAGAMLLIVAMRLAWSGSELTVLAGLFAMCTFGVAAHGGRLNFLAIAILPCQSGPAGLFYFTRLAQRGIPLMRWMPGLQKNAIAIVLPIIAVGAFGGLFVLANPNISTMLDQMFGSFIQQIESWIEQWSFRVSQFLFWGFVAVVAGGLLRPLFYLEWFEEFPTQSLADKVSPSIWFAPVRNTLFSVNVLFAAYLVFEFSTLWFREFPEGFYYAGYAHQGAFWLTVALALATGVMSLVFQGPVLTDPRVQQLKRLAWVWSALNGLLALAVYNRLFIYVGFNGLTHMRIVGMLGTSAVVAGFALVVWKTRKNYNFAWLVSRQAWALALTIVLYSVLPIDRIAVRYNVNRILSGDESACMQIGVQRTSLESAFELARLVDCDDPAIRSGVCALLALKYDEVAKKIEHTQQHGWTSFQLLHRPLLDVLERHRSDWETYAEGDSRGEELRAFREYAYQWY